MNKIKIEKVRQFNNTKEQNDNSGEKITAYAYRPIVGEKLWSEIKYWYNANRDWEDFFSLVVNEMGFWFRRKGGFWVIMNNYCCCSNCWKTSGQTTRDTFNSGSQIRKKEARND